MNSGIAGPLPWSELGRRIEGLTGSVRMQAAVRPGTCMNTASPWVHQTAHGPVLRVDRLTLAVRTLNAEEVTGCERSISVAFTTSPGSRHLLGLVATEREPLFLPRAEDVDAGVDRTVDNWVAWMEHFCWNGPWDAVVRRSTLLLKQLIHAASGSIVAAPTTSLPERPSGGKNWDYRYAWVRDS